MKMRLGVDRLLEESGGLEAMISLSPWIEEREACERLKAWWRFGVGFFKALFIHGRGGLGWFGLNWFEGRVLGSDTSVGL